MWVAASGSVRCLRPPSRPAPHRMLVVRWSGSYDSAVMMEVGEPALEGTTSDRLEHTYRSKANVGGLTHGLYRYPARFSPELAAAAVDAFTRPGEVVLDPFVGGGTSAVESLVRGRRFVGFDINPLAVLLTQVKTSPLTKSELIELEEWALTTHAPTPPEEDDVRLRNAPTELVHILSPLLGTAEMLRACGRMFEPERDVRGGGPSSDAKSDTRPSCSGISATGPKRRGRRWRGRSG